MTLENRIHHLEKQHAELDRKIDTMTRTGNFDDNTLSSLKKQRLSLQDQLSHLRRQHYEESQIVDHDDE